MSLLLHSENSDNMVDGVKSVIVRYLIPTPLFVILCWRRCCGRSILCLFGKIKSEEVFLSTNFSLNFCNNSSNRRICRSEYTRLTKRTINLVSYRIFGYKNLISVSKRVCYPRILTLFRRRPLIQKVYDSLNIQSVMFIPAQNGYRAVQHIPLKITKKWI